MLACQQVSGHWRFSLRLKVEEGKSLVKAKAADSLLLTSPPGFLFFSFSLFSRACFQCVGICGREGAAHIFHWRSVGASDWLELLDGGRAAGAAKTRAETTSSQSSDCSSTPGGSQVGVEVVVGGDGAWGRGLGAGGVAVGRAGFIQFRNSASFLILSAASFSISSFSLLIYHPKWSAGSSAHLSPGLEGGATSRCLPTGEFFLPL